MAYGDWWAQNAPGVARGPQLKTGISSDGTAVYRPSTTTSTVGSGDRLVALGGGYEPGGVVGPRPASGTNYQAQFNSLFPGSTLTPQMLEQKAAELQAMGIRLGRNAKGLPTDIILPNGQVVDVIRGSGSGDYQRQWLETGVASKQGALPGYTPYAGSGGGTGGGFAGGLPAGYTIGTMTGGGKYPLASAAGPGLAQPWTTPFTSSGDFHAPNVTDDPGFQFRMQEGQKALERSAASKGTLLTGGTLKDLAQYSQGLASQEYGNAYNRALGQNELAYNRSLGEYQMAHDIYNQNNTSLFNRLSGLAGLGQQGVGQLGTQGYANNASNLITGAGNAQAAGTVGSANAWSGALGGIANSAPLWMQMIQQPYQPMTAQQASSYPGTFYPAGSFNV